LLAAGMVGAEVISCKQVLARSQPAAAPANAARMRATREQATPLDLTEVLAHS
jgi:hypothetical protein